MIEYDDHLHFCEIFCDQKDCDKTFYITETFKDAVAAAKGRGWSLKKISGAWHHFCPLHNPWETH